MGNDPFIAVSVLLSLGADMVGTNCSFGALHMLDIVKSMYEAGGGFLSVKPNAGLPEVRDGEAYYVETAESFAGHVSEFAKYGARLVGGCCGTTPEYIEALKAGIGKMQAGGVKKRSSGIITSGVRHTAIAAIRPDNTGKLDAASDTELFERLKQSDFAYIEDRALDIASEGFDAVLVNIASAGDGDTLAKTVNTAQSYIKEPLIIKTSDAEALEKALRIYKGIAGVVTDGTAADRRLEAVARKYGSELVTLSAISHT